MRPFFAATSARYAVATLALAALAAAYAFLPLAAPAIPASPDEAANRYFAELFAERGELWRFESINLKAQGLVHPRSTRVVGEFIVPGGFLGLPVLYGAVAAVLGPAVIPYLTPLVAALAVVVWGLLVTHLFGRRIGAFAAFLLAFHPIWWYETARTLQPNVLFLALVITAAWLFLAEPFRRAAGERTRPALFTQADAALAGLALGLALATRASEAYWLVMAAVVAAWYGRHAFPWHRVAVAAVFCALTCVPFIVLNVAAYGSPFATGYGAVGDAPVGDLPHGKGAALLASIAGPLQPYLFPLGFAPRAALRHFADFGLGIVWWWSVLVACAFVALVSEARRRRRAGEPIAAPVKAYAAIALPVALWLILFYGSWTIRDNPDPDAVTIGSSYLRYWLPIYVLTTVPVAWLVARATAFLRGAARPAFAAAFLIMYALSGAADVFFAPQEGLLATRASLYDSERKAAAIFAATPEQAIIVADRADKYLFPERRVIVPLRSEATYAALGRLKHAAPLYYFGITFPESDLAWLRTVKLPPLGLTIEPVLTIGEESLYRFDPIEPSVP